MNTKEILEKIAPCSLMCYTCEAYEKGIICDLARTLLSHMDGMKDFHEKHNPNLVEKYNIFEEGLNRCSSGACSGCRNREHNVCSIKGCFILDCTEQHDVNFCGECPEFPCEKPNTIFEEEIYKQWLDGNQQIKKKGIEAFFESNYRKSHYGAYKKQY